MMGMENTQTTADRKIFALTTDQGTAMAETALCEGCYSVEANQGYAEDCASQADDWESSNGWTDCSGNEMLECVTCPRPEESLT